MRRSWSIFFIVVGIAGAVTAVAGTLRATRSDKPKATASLERPATGDRTGRLSSTAPPSENHVVRLLSPADPKFDLVLESAYPGLAHTPSFQELKPSTVLVSNESGQFVYGFVVKWTLRAGTAAPKVVYSPYLKTAGRDQLITTGVVLAPNEVTLLSPSFAFVKGHSLNALSAQVRANVAAAKRENVLSGALDGVIFGDGTFGGPDEARLRDRFECERSGQHDEGYSMTLAIRNQLSEDEIAAKLNEHIRKGWTHRAGTDRESFYHVSRGNAAQLLLQLLQQAGRAKFEQAVTRLTRMPRTQLRKV